MTNPAETGVKPNQMIANGIHASGGIGRRISMMGLRNCIGPAVPAHGDADRDADEEGPGKTDGKMDQTHLEIGQEDPLLQRD